MKREVTEERPQHVGSSFVPWHRPSCSVTAAQAIADISHSIFFGTGRKAGGVRRIAPAVPTGTPRRAALRDVEWPTGRTHTKALSTSRAGEVGTHAANSSATNAEKCKDGPLSKWTRPDANAIATGIGSTRPRPGSADALRVLPWLAVCLSLAIGTGCSSTDSSGDSESGTEAPGPSDSASELEDTGQLLDGILAPDGSGPRSGDAGIDSDIGSFEGGETELSDAGLPPLDSAEWDLPTSSFRFCKCFPNGSPCNPQWGYEKAEWPEYVCPDDEVCIASMIPSLGIGNCMRPCAHEKASPGWFPGQGCNPSETCKFYVLTLNFEATEQVKVAGCFPNELKADSIQIPADEEGP